ncbi:MAG: hypothetical protein ACRC7N_14225, partial [Clostridium sp.]
MNKYIGKYRVVCEFNQSNLEPIQDDLYIACSKEAQICRYDKNTLAYYRPSRGNSEQLITKLENLGVVGLSNHSSDFDILIYFNEESVDIIANELGAITTG